MQKLMVDEKRCYLFGRNSQMNDFTVDHGSCSRVHAALVYHKHLGRTFLVDCGSTHGMRFRYLKLYSFGIYILNSSFDVRKCYLFS